MEKIINKAFNKYQQVKLKNDCDIIESKINELLDRYADRRFDLIIGYYNQNGFNGMYDLKTDSELSLAVIRGKSIINEVMLLHDSLDFKTVTSVEIYFHDEPKEFSGWDYSLVDYDGYVLSTDL